MNYCPDPHCNGKLIYEEYEEDHTYGNAWHYESYFCDKCDEEFSVNEIDDPQGDADDRIGE